MTEPVTQADTAFVRVLFYDQPVRWTLAGLTNNLVNVDALVTVAALLSTGEKARSWPDALDKMDQARVAASDSFRVLRCRYESPLDIILASAVGFGTVSGTALIFGHRLIALFNKFQDARKKKSDVDLAVALNQEVISQLALPRPEPVELNTPEMAGFFTILARAAHALESAQRIEVSETAPQDAEGH
ncbi:hypothetical protein ACWDTP_30845 [Mycobacterium sp. NPDC003449]